jgi:hypothetical protein
MADDPSQGQGGERSLEMRLAAIEDKLSQTHISEDEMKTFERVSAALGQASPALSPQLCSTPIRISNCVVYIQACHILQCIQQCINECNGCAIAATGQQRSFGGGAGFGTLGG